MERTRSLEDFGIYYPLKRKNYKEMRTMGEWKKIEAAIFKFVAEGDTAEGKLIGVEPSRMEGATNKVYTLENAKEGNMKIFGTTILDSLMEGVSIGSMVRIVYTGETPNKQKGKNPIKNFEVYTK